MEPLRDLRRWLLRTRLGPVCFALLSTRWQKHGCPATPAGIARLSNTSASCLRAIGGPGSPLCIPSYTGYMVESGWPMALEGLRPDACYRTAEHLLSHRPPKRLLQALGRRATGGNAGVRAELSVGIGKMLVLHAVHDWPPVPRRGPPPPDAWRVELRVWRSAGLFSADELELLGANRSRRVVLRAVRQALSERTIDLRWAGLQESPMPRDLAVRGTYTTHTPPAWLNAGTHRPEPGLLVSDAPAARAPPIDLKAVAAQNPRLPRWMLQLAANGGEAEPALADKREVEVLVVARGEG